MKNRPKNKNGKGQISAALSLTMAAALLLSGCSLAREELQSPGEDRLAGIFVTEDYIEPAPPRLEAGTDGEIIASPQETPKIYGILDGLEEMGKAPVEFPGLEGYGIYGLELPADGLREAAGYNTCDPVFTDISYNVLDQEESVEASLYVPAGQRQTYYFHPVYQQTDGQVYLLPGTGISTDSFSEGQQFSKSIAQSVSRTGPGEESVTGHRYTVNVLAVETLTDAQLLYMDSDDQIIGRLSPKEMDALFQEEQPELALPKAASYLILRQAKASGAQDSRTVYDRACEYLEYMVPQGNGPLNTRRLRLLWP